MAREAAVGSFHAAVCALHGLSALAALILCIIATVGGAHQPSIAAGYTAAVWCFLVNLYLISGWYVAKRAVSYYVPTWATYAQNLAFLSGLHFLSGCLAIALGAITPLGDACSSYIVYGYYDTGSPIPHQDGYKRCRRQESRLFIARILLAITGVLHIGCSVGCCTSIWQERRLVRDRDDQTQQQLPNQLLQHRSAPPVPSAEIHGAQIQNLPTEYYAPPASERPLPATQSTVPTEYYAPER